MGNRVRVPIIIIICLLAISISLLAIMLNIRFTIVTRELPLESSKYLVWDESLNRKQSGPTCGAHATMAFLFEKGKGINDPYAIYEKFSKMKNGYVYPWEITKYLKQSEILASTWNFWLVSDKGKNEWIKSKINDNSPVVVIVGNKNYLHYITVLGFGEGKYSIYDSEIVKDRNQEKPGNIDVSENELIKRMNSAQFYGIKLKMMISESRRS